MLTILASESKSVIMEFLTLIEKNMSVYSDETTSPLSYEKIKEELAVLNLNIDVSQLHGVLTGLLVLGQSRQAEKYLSSLMLNKTGPNYRQANYVIFSILTWTQTRLDNFGFEYQLLLPSDDSSLSERVQCFVDWCEGFMEGIDMAGLSIDDIENTEVIESIQHIDEFSDLDTAEMDYGDEDEKAYFEISDFVRMAVMQLFCEFNEGGGLPKETTVHH